MKNTGLIISKTYKALLLGATISMCTTLFTSGVLALLIENRIMNEDIIGYGVLGILLISAISGACISISINETKRLMTGILTGLIYSLCLLACTALFFDGQYSGVGVTLLVAIAGSMIPGLLGMNEKKKHISRHKTRGNR